jgi:excisionase family DNA binding protein
MRERRLYPLAMTISECAEQLHCERKVLYAACRNEGLPIYRRGVRRYLLTDDVLRWIKRTWKREDMSAWIMEHSNEH